MVGIRGVATIPIRYGSSITVLMLLIGPLGFGGGATEAKQSQEGEAEIEGGGLEVPPVGQGADLGHGVHGPIKAEPVGTQQQPGVGRRQVEEGQRPGEEVRRVRRGVVGAGEVWRLAAHPVESHGQEKGPPGAQSSEAQQNAGVPSLKTERKQGRIT